MKNSLLCIVIALALFATAEAAPLGNAEVIKMSAAGLDSDVIVTSIRSSKETSFDTGADALIALKSAKVADVVIAEMIKSKAPAVAAVPEMTNGVRFTTGGKAIFGASLPRPNITVGGGAFIPGVATSVYAWFDGTDASTVVGKDVVIAIKGTNSTPKVTQFQSKKGKRYLTLNGSGNIKPELLVASAQINHDGNNSWSITFPADLPAGNYAVVVEMNGDPSATFDFLVK